MSINKEPIGTNDASENREDHTNIPEHLHTSTVRHMIYTTLAIAVAGVGYAMVSPESFQKKVKTLQILCNMETLIPKTEKEIQDDIENMRDRLSTCIFLHKYNNALRSTTQKYHISLQKEKERALFEPMYDAILNAIEKFSKNDTNRARFFHSYAQSKKTYSTQAGESVYIGDWNEAIANFAHEYPKIWNDLQNDIDDIIEEETFKIGQKLHMETLPANLQVLPLSHH